MDSKSIKLKQLWLLGFCFLVLLMISVGGITRLTRSGLSIVEWKPVSGIIPPITDADWQTQFELYKQTPEFTHVNSHFELSDYKSIFMWEYLHRVLGRLIFLFVVIPGIILWRKKIVSGKLVLSLAGLVAVQGLIGWLMVKTGLNVKPHVSPFMLALHFFTALSVLLVSLYHYVKTKPQLMVTALEEGPRGLFYIFGGALCVQVFYGCLTSGLKAGIGYNTYPLMNGQFFPEGGLFFSPIVINFLENPATVQWTHRWLGITVAALLALCILSFLKSKAWYQLKNSFAVFLGVILIQVSLGILNIIYIVPVPLAALHQLVAAILIICYFRILFLLPVTRDNK
jgi:cytochrome c oxidase assembly protein subunit 15